MEPLRRAPTTSPRIPLLNGHTCLYAWNLLNMPKHFNKYSKRMSDGGCNAGKISRCFRIWLNDLSMKLLNASANHCSASRDNLFWFGWFQNRSRSSNSRWMNFGSMAVVRFNCETAMKREIAHCKSDKSFCTAIWCKMVRAGPGKSPLHVHDGSCVSISCCIITLCKRDNFQMSCSLELSSSSDVPRSSRVDSHNFSLIRPWTTLRWLLASNLNHESIPVDGISYNLWYKTYTRTHEHTNILNQLGNGFHCIWVSFIRIRI